MRCWQIGLMIGIIFLIECLFLSFITERGIEGIIFAILMGIFGFWFPFIFTWVESWGIKRINKKAERDVKDSV